MQNIDSLNTTDKKLLEVAKKHAKLRFNEERTTIAAALRTKNGKIFTGINLKMSPRNASMCAARVALFTAVNEGEDEFDTLIEVKYSPETNDFEVVNSCGECRQVFLAYAPFQEVVDNNGKIEKKDVHELLPLGYL